VLAAIVEREGGLASARSASQSRALPASNMRSRTRTRGVGRDPRRVRAQLFVSRTNRLADPGSSSEDLREDRAQLAAAGRAGGAPPRHVSVGPYEHRSIASQPIRRSEAAAVVNARSADEVAVDPDAEVVRCVGGRGAPRLALRSREQGDAVPMSSRVDSSASGRPSQTCGARQPGVALWT